MTTVPHFSALFRMLCGVDIISNHYSLIPPKTKKVKCNI